MNFDRRRLRAQRGQRGFTLFEILVTLLLLTLWLLASAGVQSSSLKFSKAAQFRTQAIYLATDLAERMQANMAGAVLDKYIIEQATVTAPTSGWVNPCLSAVCNPLDLATADKTEWKGRVYAAGLPNAAVTVSSSGASNPITYTIVIGWNDRRDERSYGTATSDACNGREFCYRAIKTIFNPPS